MAHVYKVTDSILERYYALLEKGYSKRKAADAVKVNVTTISDHIKRLARNKKDIEYAVIKRGNGAVTFIIKGQQHHVSKLTDAHEDLLLSGSYLMSAATLEKLFGVLYTNKLKSAIKTTDSAIKVKDKFILYKGRRVPSKLIDLIDAADKAKSNDKRIKRFVDLVIKNPDQRIIDQLYDFVAHNDIEICPNGYILAYKAVRSNFTDCRTGTIDNSVGQTVEMKREDVDNNPNETCSHGLHVASMSYINKVYNSPKLKIIACIISPEHFVSIPVDYSGAKARVCKYKVSKVL